MTNYDEIINHDLECVKNDEPVVVFTESKSNICFKKLFCKCFILGILVSLVSIILYLNKNEIFKDEYEDIAARAWPHSCGVCHRKLLKCSDLKYGCCNISTYGNIENNKTSFNELHLDFHRIDRGDEKGSNCPSYRRLINRYDEYYLKYRNYEYGMNYCNSTVEDCCKLDTIYDNLYRLQNNENSYDKIKNYYDSNKHQYIELNIKGRCPNGYNIVKRYNYGYDDPMEPFILFGFMLSFMLCCLGISNIDGNRRYRY